MVKACELFRLAGKAGYVLMWRNVAYVNVCWEMLEIHAQTFEQSNFTGYHVTCCLWSPQLLARA